MLWYKVVVGMVIVLNNNEIFNKVYTSGLLKSMQIELSQIKHKLKHTVTHSTADGGVVSV